MSSAGIAFVVDENLLRVGRALTTLRSDLAVFGEGTVADVLPPGALDSQWISFVGTAGWVVITNDQRIRTGPIGAQLAQEHRLKAVHLHGAVDNNDPGAGRPIDESIGRDRSSRCRESGRSLVAVSPSGPSAVLRSEPGAVERA